MCRLTFAHRSTRPAYPRPRLSDDCALAVRPYQTSDSRGELQLSEYCASVRMLPPANQSLAPHREPIQPQDQGREYHQGMMYQIFGRGVQKMRYAYIYCIPLVGSVKYQPFRRQGNGTW